MVIMIRETGRVSGLTDFHFIMNLSEFQILFSLLLVIVLVFLSVESFFSHCVGQSSVSTMVSLFSILREVTLFSISYFLFNSLLVVVISIL